MIKVVYFASIREQVGLGEESLELPENIVNVAQLSAWLQAQRGTKWQGALSNPSTLVAVNQEMVNADQVIKPGDEVAFFPPVTGG
jgi:molybdopterin synthase sulfur carrier subunit